MKKSSINLKLKVKNLGLIFIIFYILPVTLPVLSGIEGLLVTYLYSETLNLEQCLGIALKENPQMKIAEQNRISAKAKRAEAFSGYLPNVSGSFSYLKKNEVEGLDALGSLTSVSPSFRLSFADEIYDSKLSLTQPIFMWGKIYQSNRQAKLNYKYYEEDYIKTRRNIVYSVKNAFYNFILAKQMVSIAKEASDVNEYHLKSVERFYQEGKASSYDVSRAKVLVANSKTNFIRSNNGLELSRETLINVLNIKNKDIEFTGELEYVPEEKDLEDLIMKAMENRSEIKQILLQEDISKSLVKLASTGNKPNILLTGTAEWQNTAFETTDWYNTWMALAVLNIPIFDGFSTYNRTKQAKANLNQIIANKELLEEGVKFEVRAAYLNFKQAKDSIEANKENVKAAKENLTTAQKRFNLGLMSDLEVRDAQLDLTQAETNYVQALYDYNIAIASLDKAVGK
ncbi:MAG: hypothetical protein A2539_09355 [Elusimicrobia bacterium RIFOXYD2_FULL_34_15]|nr:MAG: hypothetical protein A2539_09355 [Elusimicrobia bacterium RIFOXYD2_FULL_34_15]